MSGRIADVHARIAGGAHSSAFVHLRPSDDVAAEYAASLRGSGPLAGMLLAVKDNSTSRDCRPPPHVRSSPTSRDRCPRGGGPRAAGAVVLGKTNLDQFATGLVGTRSPTGRCRIRGGWSCFGRIEFGFGGRGRLGYADIAIGTDTAGSVVCRQALQGIVGIKATVGLVSTAGVVPACASYDCVTILARDLPLAEAAMAVMVVGAPERAWPADLRFAAPAAPRVAVPSRLPALDEAWQAAFVGAVDRLHACGVEPVEVDMSAFLAAARLLYDGALVAERYDAVGEFVDGNSVRLDPTVAKIVTDAARHSAVDLLRDRRAVARLRESAFAQIAGCDALMVPTAPTHPTIAQVAADPVGVNARMGTYTNFANLFDMCAVAVPAGTVDEGLRGVAQFGVTLLADAFGDAVVADLARRFVAVDESAPSWPESAGAPSCELAVFGAHLRGQPLESELSGRGARWSGPISTAPRYRLKALDTAPPKPGLLRCEDADGASIAGERWVLAPAALGEFLTALPAPMMLGAVELDDGTWITGFGCDHAAGSRSRDITAHGGWVAALG